MLAIAISASPHVYNALFVGITQLKRYIKFPENHQLAVVDVVLNPEAQRRRQL